MPLHAREVERLRMERPAAVSGLSQAVTTEMTREDIIALLGRSRAFKDYSIRYKTEDNLVDFGLKRLHQPKRTLVISFRPDGKYPLVSPPDT